MRAFTQIFIIIIIFPLPFFLFSFSWAELYSWNYCVTCRGSEGVEQSLITLRHPLILHFVTTGAPGAAGGAGRGGAGPDWAAGQWRSRSSVFRRRMGTGFYPSGKECTSSKTLNLIATVLEHKEKIEILLRLILNFRTKILRKQPKFNHFCLNKPIIAT